MVGRKRLSTRFVALMLAVIMLFTPVLSVKVHAGVLDTIKNSALVKSIGKVAPVFTAVNTACDIAGRIYDGVTQAQKAESGQGVKQFFLTLMGKQEDETMAGIASSLTSMNGKLDDIAANVEELSADLATANSQLNTIIAQLGSGIEDIKVTLHSSVLQMQEWTTIYSQINNFYSKYGEVRTTLEIKVDTLNDRAADFDRFLQIVSEHKDGEKINAAINKLDVAGSNYSSLAEEEKALLDTEISFDGKTYTVYRYVTDYAEFVRDFLKDTYDDFADGYSDDMYATLQNMANFILGNNWQSGNVGIGEVYYKLAVMGSSTNKEAHTAYESFVVGAQYDFLLTAYVCSLSLKSQIEYLELTGGNSNTISTFKAYLNNIDDLIAQVLQYSDYEYEKCILEYDFNGFVPEGNNTYDDYVVYYGNSVNYVNSGAQTTRFVNKSSLSHFGDPTVSNQYMRLAAGETAQFKVWFRGEQIQGNYKLYSSNNCIVVNEDGTVAALHPGTATISMMIDGIRYDVVQVSVSSSYAKYNGSGTDTWVYYKNGVKQTFTCAGEGYEYMYSADIFSTAGGSVIDTNNNLNQVLTNYIKFTDGASLEDYEVILNHKYGQIKQADEFYLQFVHHSVGTVSLVKGAGNQASVIVIPIINGSNITKRDTAVTTTQPQEPNTVYIYTKEDLINWKTQYDTDYASDKVNVVLMADIDFEWDEWTGVRYALVKKDVTAGPLDEQYNTPNYEKYDVTTYTFDGNGHTIKNITFAPVQNTVTYTQEVQSEGKTVKKYLEQPVVTYGFFSKLAGELKNLTIENVEYTGYPYSISSHFMRWTYNSVTYDTDWPRVTSVFAALVDSDMTWYKNSSGKPVENTTNWTSGITNCVASGSTGLNTNYDMYYNPFGGLVDIKYNTGQKASVSNCVYGMTFAVSNPEPYHYYEYWNGWTVAIFCTSQPNLYTGDFIYKTFFQTRPKTYIVYTDGMTETERNTAKANVRVLPNSSLPDSNHSDYMITEAEYYDLKFWTDRGWNANSVNRMYIEGSDPAYRSDFYVDVSNLKMYYGLNETLDKENLAVYYKDQRVQTNKFSVSVLEGTTTAGVKTVQVTYKPESNVTYTATFEVEYVGYTPQYFTYDGTTYAYSAGTGHKFVLPDRLFYRSDGYTQVGWFVQGTEDDESKLLTFGESVSVTGEVTYVPAWKAGEIIKVVFSGGGNQIVYEVPEGANITAPVIEYNSKIYTNPRWVSTGANRINLTPGNKFTVNSRYANNGTITFLFTTMTRGDIPYEISIYFQNLEDDGYTFAGTYEGTYRNFGYFCSLYGKASSSLTGMSVNESDFDYLIVKSEAINCGEDKYLGSQNPWMMHTIDGNGDTSHVTIWLNRQVYTVTWKDIDGNTIKTESLRWGAMPIPPAAEESAPAGYTPVWNAAPTAVTEDIEYTVTELKPKDGISYTVNHMWQNVDDDGYTLYEYESLTGTTGTDAIATAKDYVGFAVKTVEEKTIAGDGSTVVNIYYDRNEYTVTWDIEGTPTTETYRYGATPSWKGETPTKQSDGKHNYTFKSWGDIQPVTDNATYTAQFDSHLNTFTITWDVDGVTTTEVYTWGDIPEYKGETPTRDATVQYTYTFKDWGEITAVTSDKTYTANFDATVNKYTITWIVEGDSSEEKYEYGATPSYKGTTPVKPSDEAASYIFNGWGQIETVSGDATYIAQFASVANTYTITWDVNGEKLTERYTYGDMPSYKGVTPVKLATVQYSYTFAGWGEITEVTGNKTYIAQFTETVNKYTITWSIDGVQVTEEYEYGATPSYKGETPAREADAQYTYSFRDWGTILTVTGDKTYTATFNTTVNKYNITWIIDGIQFTESYDYGAMPAYKGYTPTKDATAQYTYTFAGWGEIVKVTGNKTYTAIFDSTVNKYTITWVVNGEEITEEYEYGAMPTYKGESPVKESNAQYTYTFEGFGSILSVTGDKTYTAQFKETVNKYTITWVVNGEETTEEYEYGAMPSYKGETPSKESNGQTAYTFAGWGGITTVTGDKTYTAIFSAEPIKYTITWVIGDTQITEKYEYGQTPSYKGETPVKQNTAQHTYTFDGWGDIATVSGDKTYTAKFSATVNKYTITWNIEGTLTEEEYEYGKTPSYKGATPTKDATAQYTYTFKDWGEITDVTADKTYTANFAATVNKYTITWVVNGDQFTEEYEYGATPVYKGFKPTKPSTEQYTYEFSGWGEITKVTGDKTYTATFHATYIVPDEITSSTYNVGENTISKIAAGTSSKEFIESINESQHCKVLKGDSVVSDDTAVGTGMTVDIVDGDKTNASYTIIVTGDTNGDGNITITDMLAIKAHVLGKTELTRVYTTAADTNGDGAITITDFLQLKAQLLGKGDIEAR